MHRKMITIPNIFSLVIVFIILLPQKSFPGNKISGFDKIVTEHRAVKDFNKVFFTGVGHLYIKQANEEALRIEADDNIINEISTEVIKKTLHIKRKSHIGKSSRPIKFYLLLKHLDEVSLSGSGAVTSEGCIQAENLKIRLSGSGKLNFLIDTHNLSAIISGSGEISISGVTDFQKIVVNESGIYHAKELISQKAQINVSNSALAEVDVSEQLDVKIFGMANIIYSGDPKVEERVYGFGYLQKARQ